MRSQGNIINDGLHRRKPFQNFTAFSTNISLTAEERPFFDELAQRSVGFDLRRSSAFLYQWIVGLN